MTRKVKADLHNHLKSSSRLDDSYFNLAIDIASERLGPGGTFGMINFDDKRYERFIRSHGYERVYVGENRNAVYVPEKDILIVKGQEVPTQQGHLLILGLGYDEHMKQHQSLEFTLEEARGKNATIILDHGFSRLAGGAGEYLRQRGNHPLLEQIDAIEVHNGEVSLFPPSNLQAQLFYNGISTYETGAISTSDGHSLYELGTSWTEIDEINRENKKYFLKSLKESVRNTRYAQMKKYRSLIGAIDHGLDMKLWIPLISAIGLGRLFDTERPID